jgi:3-oxoacyl-[acyl-carrier protein] reductase
VLDVNLTGVMICNREAARRMIAELTKCFAAEVGCAGIRVNAVAPSSIERGMTLPRTELRRLRRQGAALPLGRTAQPEEVASVALFLCSDESS